MVTKTDMDPTFKELSNKRGRHPSRKLRVEYVVCYDWGKYRVLRGLTAVGKEMLQKQEAQVLLSEFSFAGRTWDIHAFTHYKHNKTHALESIPLSMLALDTISYSIS